MRSVKVKAIFSNTRGIQKSPENPGYCPNHRMLIYSYPSLNLLMILGMDNEKTKRATEKKTFEEKSSPQFPLAQTSLSVPMKKMKMKVPTMMPRPVPKK